MKTHPAVSVIIPTYNYAQFISNAIESVLNSSFPVNDIEIIVIDDGSTDDTAQKVKVYEDKVMYIAQENLGKAWATKVGIDHAQGRYIFNLDADDLFLPNKIQEVVDIFDKDRDIVHVAHPAMCWNVDDDSKKSEQIPEIIMGKKMLGKDLLYYFYKRGILFGGGSTFAARNEVLRTVKIPKEVDMFIDEYLLLVSLTQGYSFLIEQPLSIWRIHGKNFSNTCLDANNYKLPIQRKIASLDSVLNNLVNLDIAEDLEVLYSLRNKILSLYIKEKIDQKYLSDILRLWFDVYRIFSFFGYEGFEILKNYHILNRTLPTGILRWLKILLKKDS